MRMEHHGMLRMVGYGRVSTDEEKQLYSLENQMLFFNEFASSHGYKLVRVYADEGISGKQLKKRDEFIRMLDDAELGIFDVVVVKDVSRFARNTVDLLTSIRKLRSMGVNVLFVNNNQQTLGESEFVITLLGAMAQEESANLSKRVQFGKDVTAKRGRVPKTILGYDYVDNYTLKINPEEAVLVRRIFEMYISGNYGMAVIAATLRGEGTRTKLGCDYTESYIRRVLTNPIYCGDMVNHKTQIADFINGVRKSVPENEQYHHERPELAIIKREIFEQAQKLREERYSMQLAKGGDPRRRYTSRYLFSGLVRCGECGCTMYRQNVNRKYKDEVDGYWRCKNGTRMKNSTRCKNKAYVPDKVLREALSEALEKCIQDKETFARELLESLYEQEKDNRPVEEVIKEKKQSIEKQTRQKQKYIDMYTNDIITMSELKTYIDGISQQIETLTEDISKLNRAVTQEKNTQREIENCLQSIENFLELDSATNSDVRKFLSRVEVSENKKLSFYFKID